MESSAAVNSVELDGLFNLLIRSFDILLEHRALRAEDDANTKSNNPIFYVRQRMKKHLRDEARREAAVNNNRRVDLDQRSADNPAPTFLTKSSLFEEPKKRQNNQDHCLIC